MKILLLLLIPIICFSQKVYINKIHTSFNEEKNIWTKVYMKNDMDYTDSLEELKELSFEYKENQYSVPLNVANQYFDLSDLSDLSLYKLGSKNPLGALRLKRIILFYNNEMGSDFFVDFDLYTGSNSTVKDIDFSTFFVPKGKGIPSVINDNDILFCISSSIKNKIINYSNITVQREFDIDNILSAYNYAKNKDILFKKMITFLGKKYIVISYEKTSNSETNSSSFLIEKDGNSISTLYNLSNTSLVIFDIDVLPIIKNGKPVIYLHLGIPSSSYGEEILAVFDGVKYILKPYSVFNL